MPDGPRVRALPPEILPAVPAQPGRPAVSGAGRTAVLVLHGMGQQIPFQTMDMVAHGLQGSDASAWRVGDELGVREVRIGDETLKRVEVALENDAGESRPVHVYESYWAPLTEGKVRLADVAAFLVRGALNGMRMDTSGGFRRWIFGRNVTFPQLPGATPILALGLGVFLSLASMNALAAAIVARQAWPGPLLRAELTLALLVFLGALAPLVVLLLLGRRARLRERRQAEGRWAHGPRGLAFYRSAGMAAFGVALGAALAFLLAAGALVVLRAAFPGEIPPVALGAAYAVAVPFPALLYAAWILLRRAPLAPRDRPDPDAPDADLALAREARAMGRLWLALATALALFGLASLARGFIAAGIGLEIAAVAASWLAARDARRLRHARVVLSAARARRAATPAPRTWSRVDPSRSPSARGEERSSSLAPEPEERRPGADALALAALLVFATFTLVLILAPLVHPAVALFGEREFATSVAASAVVVAGAIAIVAGLAATGGSPPASPPSVASGATLAAALLLALLVFLLASAGGLDRGLVGGVWLAIAAVSLIVRRLLVQYLGDVAAYVDSQTLDRFHELRREIKARAKRTADAIYAARTHDGKGLYYDRVLVVGHSLGSVVAYDTLNALLADEHLAPAAPSPQAKPSDHVRRVAERTPLLLTFGSPLDRTAFVFAAQRRETGDPREALAMLAQPLIESPEYREHVAWWNVWSPEDVISSELRFYEDPALRRFRVQNVADLWASTPLLAHTEYWTGDAVWRILKEHVVAPPPKL